MGVGYSEVGWGGGGGVGYSEVGRGLIHAIVFNFN